MLCITRSLGHPNLVEMDLSHSGWGVVWTRRSLHGVRPPHLARFLTRNNAANQSKCSWANEVCEDDSEERAITVASMNEIAYVFQSWLPLVVWQQVDAPEYRSGYITLCVSSVIMIATSFVIRMLSDRELSIKRMQQGQRNGSESCEQLQPYLEQFQSQENEKRPEFQESALELGSMRAGFSSSSTLALTSSARGRYYSSAASIADSSQTEIEMDAGQKRAN